MNENIKILRDEGLLILPSFFNEQRIKKVVKEAENVLNNDSSCIRYNESNHISSFTGYKYNIKKFIFLRNISSCIHTKLFKSIHHDYANYLGDKIKFDDSLIIHRSLPLPETVPPSGEPHWDFISGIKTWIFLNDIDIRQGPVNIFKGSHLLNREKRINCKYRKQPEGGNRNIVENPLGEPLKGDFKAGDVIIFDTDCTHQARPITEGCRFIIRSMSRRINQRSFDVSK